eukprot:XP_011664511.1 PREDICTED: fibropellin-1-like [Strongylocentrotus purpuratus]
MCAVQLNPCLSDPCLNQGTCVNRVTSFECACAVGFIGIRCETNINECASIPCANGGSCRDGINQYVCSCTTNFQGPRCRIGRNITLTTTPTTATLTFDWPAQPGVTRYGISLQTIDGSSTPPTQTLPGSQTSATFTGLEPGKTYRVTLETNADGVDYPLSEDFGTTILRK